MNVHQNLLVQQAAPAAAEAPQPTVPPMEATAAEFANLPATALAPGFLRANSIVPLQDTDQYLVVAMVKPDDQEAIEALRFAAGKPVRVKSASPELVSRALEELSGPVPSEETEEDQFVSAGDADDLDNLRDMALGAPVVQYVAQLFNDAVARRATDIHIEPYQKRLSVRLRIDGMLNEIADPPLQMARAIVSRIKILSGLNIAERRLPQDGRSRIKLEGLQLDVRVATVPTIHGESVVIRLLDNVRRELTLPALGFSQVDQEEIYTQLAAPHGMVIVTGPTGSGKTTTLATALGLIDPKQRKILTVEDPVEYEVEGVNQIQAKPEIGLSFASTLRAFLRHDPDVIMVGEMRDGETAGIGIHAALTGHLVLTTLHTNNAAGAVARLLDMGVDAPLLSSALRCVVAQRLVRRLCQHCRQPYRAAPPVPANVLTTAGLNGLGEMNLWAPVGCEHCHGTGYTDRLVICEVLSFDGELRAMIGRGVPSGEIQNAALHKGFRTMIEDGLEKCRIGLTSPEEVVRVALDL